MKHTRLLVFSVPGKPEECVHAKLCPTLCDPIACQAPLSTDFSRQEYWSGLPFPALGISLTRGSNLSPALAGGFFTCVPTGKPKSEAVETILYGTHLGFTHGRVTAGICPENPDSVFWNILSFLLPKRFYSSFKNWKKLIIDQ